MKPLEQARMFLSKAAEDEGLLDAVMANPKVSDAIYGFHAQQAAEKLLKALLSARSVRFPKSHDLHELLNLLENAGETLPPEVIRVDELTPFAVDWRYDSFLPAASVDRAKMRSLVAGVRAFIERQIGSAADVEGRSPPADSA